jgi:signal transduction histidine kinase
VLLHEIGKGIPQLRSCDVGHVVSYEGPGRLAWTCRPSILTCAISNVVDNAVKHSCVVVTVALRTRDDGMVEIDVTDDGPGIPSSLREKVFDPFFKGDNARRSTNRSGFGLGLSIARDVVKGHGGGIELLDRKPRGLIVPGRSLLPLVDEPYAMFHPIAT